MMAIAVALAVLVVLIGAAFALDLYRSSANAQTLSPTVQIKLQAQLDSDFSPGLAKVMSIQLVKSEQRFDGSANVLVLDKALTLPFAVSHDSDSTIVAVTSGDLERVRSSFQDTLSDLPSKMPEYILDHRFRSLFPQGLAKAADVFGKDLATGEAIRANDMYYIGEGCRAHHCMTHRAAWVIDKKTGHMIAVIGDFNFGEVGKKNYTLNFEVYGPPNKRTDVPQPLEEWERDFSDWLNSAANTDYMMAAMRGAEGDRDDEN